MSSYHIPVLLKKSIEGLNINPNGIYVDVTFGGGGYSNEILSNLTDGQLFAFDQDKDAEKNLIENKNLTFIRGNFKYIKNYLKFYNITKVDGIVADLGVSSHQFDSPERGFSFRHDAKLDMRMNNGLKLSAADVLNQYTEKQLLFIFKNYGEIKNYYKLTKTIINKRIHEKFDKIEHFKETIKLCTPERYRHKYLAKVFQALRIEINAELDVLKILLQDANSLLNDKGRLVVITYHSLEDRLVKNYIKSGKFYGEVEKDFYGNILAPLKAINRKIIVASESEISQNNRARSAKLRIAEKILRSSI